MRSRFINQSMQPATGIMSPYEQKVATSPRNMALEDCMTNSAFEGVFPQHSIDTLPLRNAPPESIDREKVLAHIADARNGGRYTGPEEPEEYLALHKCIAELDGVPRATLAGLLCFGRNPQMFVPQAVVDIGHYRGTESVSFDVIHLEKNIGGTIFDQLQRVEEYLWRNTHHGMTLPER